MDEKEKASRQEGGRGKKEMKGERDEREKGLVTEIRRGENRGRFEAAKPNKTHTVNYKERKIITH